MFVNTQEKSIAFNGEGTKENPYLIEDMEDFVTLNKVNSDIFGEYPLNLNFLCKELVTH